MILRKLLTIILLISYYTGFSQEKKVRLNFILVIDDEIVETGVSNSFFLIKNSTGNPTDSIIFRHEVGDIILSSEGYNKLISLNPNTKVLITFTYKEFCPDTKQYEYSKEIQAGWLVQRYIIFKVYNFEKKKNHRNFLEKQGNGFEVFIPATGLVLPRKKIKKANTTCN